jgi:uncharacterized protein (DUF2236 family)
MRMEVSRRVTAERLLLLGWTRAILLQLAHPLIAAGVYDHSGFRASPMAAASRLHHTVAAMLEISFGDREASTAALDRIGAIHTRVHGTLPAAVGPFAAGTSYSAEDPALVLWVHATLADSMINVYEQLIGALTPPERDAYCAESAWVAIELGAVDADVPRTWAAMQAYIDRMLASGAITVGPQAYELSRALLWPSLARVMPGAGWLNRRFTAALLPPGVRDEYGLTLTPAQVRTVRCVSAAIRRARLVTPHRLATWAASRRVLQPG